MNDEENKNRGYLHTGWGWRCFFIAPLVILAISGMGAIVMWLWNCTIPALFPTVGTLTYWHAIGLLILCKILFGGFRGGRHRGWRHRHFARAAWNEKWGQMSEEEKAKFKEEWKTRCRGGRC
ncbi:MAG: hypothetical protein ACLQQ4_07700 [Bacteroidia bacterium]